MQQATVSVNFGREHECMLIVMVAFNNAGISSLEAVLAQGLPDYLADNPMPDGGKPWGTMNSTNTNQPHDASQTPAEQPCAVISSPLFARQAYRCSAGYGSWRKLSTAGKHCLVLPADQRYHVRR